VSKLIIVIPARRGSSRFPSKVIHPILGKPLVVWVVEGASKCSWTDEIIVATDDNEIKSVVEAAGYKAVITRDDHPSGTDRVWEVAKSIDCDWILNLQGDEPLITGDVLDSLAGEVMDGNANDIEIVTLVRTLEPSEVMDPNRVKVVVDTNMNALYFSRSPIPHIKPSDHISAPEYLLHVGLYLYRRDILEKFVNLPQTPLELSEGLEQLRALENGIRIKCVKTDHEFLGVDTPPDVIRVETALRAREMGDL